jgi:serine/threonine protein kinase
MYDTKNNVPFARKVVRLSRISQGEAENELRALSKLYGRRGHENLVQFFGHGSLSPFLHYLDMELCDGNLKDRVLDTALSGWYVFLKSSIAADRPTVI